MTNSKFCFSVGLTTKKKLSDGEKEDLLLFIYSISLFFHFILHSINNLYYSKFINVFEGYLIIVFYLALPYSLITNHRLVLAK